MCFPELAVPSDRPYWIRRAGFQEVVHHDNYLCRDVQRVHAMAYLDEWFVDEGPGSRLRFRLPAVYLDGGRIKFINGRHRTAVLVEHMELLPMAFSKQPERTDITVFDTIVHSGIALGCPFELPTLPLLTRDELARRTDCSSPRIPTPDPW